MLNFFEVIYVIIVSAIIISPCHIAQLLKEDVDSWSYTSPPACLHIDVLAEDGPDTALFLRYYAPVRGIIPEHTSLLISQQLQTTGL